MSESCCEKKIEVVTDYSTLISEIMEARDKIALEKEHIRELEKQYEILEKELIETMEFDGLVTAKSKEGAVVSIIGPILRASTNKERSEEAAAWLKNNDYSYALKSTIHAGTLSKILRERVEVNAPIPDDLFKIYFQKDLRITK